MVDSSSVVPIVAVNRSPSDGVTFASPAVCVEEKLDPFLDEKFEVGSSLERTVEIGLKNFQTAGKRKREQEVREADTRCFYTCGQTVAGDNKFSETKSR